MTPDDCIWLDHQDFREENTLFFNRTLHLARDHRRSRWQWLQGNCWVTLHRVHHCFCRLFRGERLEILFLKTNGWNLKIPSWKRENVYKPSIFWTFHVSFWGVYSPQNERLDPIIWWFGSDDFPFSNCLIFRFQVLVFGGDVLPLMTLEIWRENHYGMFLKPWSMIVGWTIY